MKTKIPQIENMRSSNGNDVPNQFKIFAKEGVYFQSYSTIIAFKPVKPLKSGATTILDKNKWDYSKTTGIYRNQFLNETIAETRQKIKSGQYVLKDLN